MSLLISLFYCKGLENNPNQQSPLVLAYAKSIVHKLITGKKNPRIEPKVMNFICYIDTISPNAAEIVSANLPGGPSKHWMQKLNKRERTAYLLDSSVRDMSDGMKRGIHKHCISGCNVSFSLSIDATKVPSELENSTTYAAIMRGAHPNHYISTRDMTSMKIESLLKQWNASPTSITLADEIKVVIMSFQNFPLACHPLKSLVSDHKHPMKLLSSLKMQCMLP